MRQAFALWTKEEDDVLRAHYPMGGEFGCQDLLPHRSYDGMNKRARVLGLKAPRRKYSKTHYVTHDNKLSVSKEEFVRLKAAVPADTRDLTGRIFGDPLPGRSALDMKLRAEQIPQPGCAHSPDGFPSFPPSGRPFLEAAE